MEDVESRVQLADEVSNCHKVDATVERKKSFVVALAPPKHHMCVPLFAAKPPYLPPGAAARNVMGDLEGYYGTKYLHLHC
jgi:hypothetical protein